MRNKAVSELINKINNENLISIDNNGIGTLAEGGIEKLLPEGLTKDQLDRAVEFQSQAGAALAIAYGTKAKGVFDKNKDLQSGKFTTTLSKHTTLDVSIDRTREFNVPNVKEGEPKSVTKHGYMTIAYNTEHAVSNSTINKEVQNAWAGLSS